MVTKLKTLRRPCVSTCMAFTPPWSGFSASLQASNRSYVYSMSPGGQVTPTMLNLIRPKATMARVTNDFWDQWENGWKVYHCNAV